ncbi:MAG: ABC transporter permease [bacterium]
MLENIRLAFRGIWSHKLRSFLTMLGVIIGIASIIAIVSTIAGSQQALLESMIGAGNNAVTISLKQGDYEVDQTYTKITNYRPVSDKTRADIRMLEHVVDASFFLVRRSDYNSTIYTNEGTSLSFATIYGVDGHYLHTIGCRVSAGREFVEEDFTGFRKVMMLDATAAKMLFPEGEAVGKSVEIGSEVFTIIGLYRKEDNFVPTYESMSEYLMSETNEAGVVLIPDACWPILYKFDEIEQCVVRADKTDNMSKVGNDALELLRAGQVISANADGNAAESAEYQVDDVLTKARNKAALNDSMNILLLCVAGIALLVGGIGVMNIMLVSVTERTSEIGLKKAVGAKRGQILGQFLTESAVLTSLGGIFGVVSGLIFAHVLSTMTGTPVAISIPSIILAVAFSMVIGIVFGLLPSMKAANLDPIEALRRE